MSSGTPYQRTSFQSIRSVIFYIGFGLATLIWAGMVALTWPLPLHWRHRFSRLWGRRVLWWLRWAGGVNYQVQGRENLHAPSQATLYLSKHQSNMDSILLMALLPDCCWIMKKQVKHFPIIGWATQSLQSIYIDRSKTKGEALQHVLQEGERALKSGRNMLIFPEGTRLKPGQSKMHGRSGSLLAQQVGCPVVMIAHNCGVFWPSDDWALRPGTAQVVISEPMTTQGKNAEQISQEVMEWMEQTSQQLPIQV